MIKITFTFNADDNTFNTKGTMVAQHADMQVEKGATSGEYIAAGLVLFLSSSSSQLAVQEMLEKNVEDVHGVVGMLISKHISELLGKEEFNMRDIFPLLMDGELPGDVVQLLTSLSESHANGNSDGLVWGQRLVPNEEAEKINNKMKEEEKTDMPNLNKKTDSLHSTKSSKTDDDFNLDII